MPDSINVTDFGALYDDEINFEETVDERFSTEGIDTEDGAWIPDTPTQEAPKKHEAAPDTRSAEERIEDIFHRLAPQHTCLRSVLTKCIEPQTFAQVEAVVKDAQQYNASVLSPFNICSILAKAGALAHVVEDGTPYEDYVNPPQEVIIDGEKFLKPSEAPASYWQTTPEGQAQLDKYDPYGLLADVYAEQPHALPLFKRVLSYLEDKGTEGATITELGDIVDKDVLAQEPRLFAGYFVERLERCDAVVWRNNWCITEIGRTSLAGMADVTDPGYTPVED